MSRNIDLPAQGRLFDRLDSPMTGKVQGERSVMDYPLFALSKRPPMEDIDFELGKVSIRIKPSALGVATMWDKEVLIYVSSIIANRMKGGGAFDPEVKFNTHDFFRVTGVTRPSKKDYERFSEALARLQGTQIQTNIETGNRGTKGYFSWFSEANAETRRLSDGTVQLEAVRVQVCTWLGRALRADSKMYSYHHDYFKLGSIERRLYEIAQCYCGEGQYEFALDYIATKIGSQGSVSKLRQNLKRIEADDRLPDYSMSVIDVISDEVVLDSRGRKIRKPQTTIILRPREQQQLLFA